MLSFGTARRAVAPPCLSTRTRSDRHFLTWLVLAQGGGGGGGMGLPLSQPFLWEVVGQ